MRILPVRWALHRCRREVSVGSRRLSRVPLGSRNLLGDFLPDASGPRPADAEADE